MGKCCLFTYCYFGMFTLWTSWSMLQVDLKPNMLLLTVCSHSWHFWLFWEALLHLNNMVWSWKKTCNLVSIVNAFLDYHYQLLPFFFFFSLFYLSWYKNLKMSKIVLILFKITEKINRPLSCKPGLHSRGKTHWFWRCESHSYSDDEHWVFLGLWW